jgi:small subunit ribosomal protein S7
MPRRREVPKREVTPDPKYLSETVAKFITVVMKSGKKSVAEKIVYGALDTMAERSKKDPIEMFNQALTNVRPPRISTTECSCRLCPSPPM